MQDRDIIIIIYSVAKPVFNKQVSFMYEVLFTGANAKKYILQVMQTTPTSNFLSKYCQSAHVYVNM